MRQILTCSLSVSESNYGGGGKEGLLWIGSLQWQANFQTISTLRSIIDTSCYRTLTLTKTFSVSMAGAGCSSKDDIHQIRGQEERVVSNLVTNTRKGYISKNRRRRRQGNFPLSRTINTDSFRWKWAA